MFEIKIINIFNDIVSVLEVRRSAWTVKLLLWNWINSQNHIIRIFNLNYFQKIWRHRSKYVWIGPLHTRQLVTVEEYGKAFSISEQRFLLYFFSWQFTQLQLLMLSTVYDDAKKHCVDAPYSKAQPVQPSF